MNANIDIIQEDLVAVNFNYIDIGYIRDFSILPGASINGKDASLSEDGVIILNKNSPVYEVLLKIMPRVMSKSDELLKISIQEFDNKSELDDYERFYRCILGWEIKRRSVKVDYLKRPNQDTLLHRITNLFRKG